MVVQAPVQQAPPPLVYVIFDAEISQVTAESLLATMANLATNRVVAVYLAMSSGGGDVTQGITLYNALRGMPFELTTHNIGNIDSIGNAVFLSGSKRYASPHSTFMFHGVSWNITQPTQLPEKNAVEIVTGIKREQGRIGAIMQERTQIPATSIPRLFREAQTKNATEAVALGIVDQIQDFQMAVGVPVISLTFKR